MEAQILPVTVAQPAPPPTLQSDQRPTADTAALVRDPRPDIPLPMPASIAQKGAVAQARVALGETGPARVERVLKPYGVVMLPQGPTSDAPTKDDAATFAGESAAASDDAATRPDGQSRAATDDPDRPDAA